jgi:hypothetical protein
MDEEKDQNTGSECESQTDDRGAEQSETAEAELRLMTSVRTNLIYIKHFFLILVSSHVCGNSMKLIHKIIFSVQASYFRNQFNLVKYSSTLKQWLVLQIIIVKKKIGLLVKILVSNLKMFPNSCLELKKPSLHMPII